MPRRPRLHISGGFYHVTMRGNHRQRLFFNGEHREILDALMSEAIDRYGWRVHAYCWMTNHVHMVVETADVPLGRIMNWVASRHARMVQRDLTTTGHLFERRYHALLVDKDAYLLELVRYIHLNPVHAGIVHDPIQYRWSSHLAYVDARSIPWVTCNFVLKMLHPDLPRAKVAYAEFIQKGINAGLDPTILIAHRRDSRILGGDGFMEKMTYRPRLKREDRKRSRTLEDIIQEGCQLHDVTLEALQSDGRIRQLTRARAWIAYCAMRENIATVTAIAKTLHRTESTIRELIKRHESSCRERYRAQKESARSAPSIGGAENIPRDGAASE